jgi:uncharacterized glyoxalase superfamily protein PhnB
MTTHDTAGARTVSSEVTVAVDPQTAFAVFTDEIDLWWVRGPINFHDGARAIGMRCEPGVGGRLLELYSEDGSDALVLGRITAWQPGELLAWDSGVDDVMVEVRFRAADGGTTVTVNATIPAGGADNGGTAWVRVVPRWLGAWVARRETAGREPGDTSRLGLAIYYAKPRAAASWLADAFGLGPADEFGGDEYEHSWIEFRIGNCSVMLFPRTVDHPEDVPVTHVPWVFVDDLDAHLEHARSRGATIVSGIRQLGYRAYEAADLEGNRWTFAQARPTMRG